MFRHLLKSFFVNLMCVCLVVMNLEAYALDESSSDSSSSSSVVQSDTTNNSKQMVQAKPTNGATRDSNGNYKKTEKKNFNGINDPDMLASIAMLAAGFIAVRLKEYDPMTLDMNVAAAGGAAFIAGEVMTNLSFKKKMDDMSVEITKNYDGTKDQAQIQRLEDLKKSYEEAKKTTSKKMMLQKAAAAAFTGAAAIAGYRNYQEYIAFKECTSAIQLASVCGGTGGAHLESTMLLINKIRMTPGPSKVEETKINQLKLQAEADMLALKANCEAMDASTSGTANATAAGISASTACKSALQIETINQSSKRFVFNNSSTSQQKITNFLLLKKDLNITLRNDQISPVLKMTSKILNLIFPIAQADWLPLLGLTSGAVLPTFNATLAGLAKETDYLMISPYNRVMAWGSLGSISYLAAESSKGQVDNIDENIKKIDKILSEMYSLNKGIKSDSTTEQKIKMAPTSSSSDSEVISTNPNIKTDCLTGSNSDNCKSLSDQLVSMNGYGNLPEAFKTIASQSAKMGDSLSGTTSISGSGLSAVSKLSNSASAISKLNNQIKDKLNDQLVKDGKAKIDFDGEEKKIIGNMKNTVLKALQNQGMSAGAFLASVGMSPVSSEKSQKPIASAVKSGGVSGLSQANSTLGNSKEKEFTLDLKENSPETNLAPEAMAAANEKYDIGQNDINTNSGESIFQLISNRYLRSGYPKLLEEDALKK